MSFAMTSSVLLGIVSCFLIVECQNPIRTIRTFLQRGTNQMERELPDQKILRSEYDFIIVGAGSAGCAVANRLSENLNWNILLIEAGQNENFLMDIPMVVHYLQGYSINWGYKTEKSEKYCLGMKNNQCNWPRGKVMGGSSVLNYMVYTRGNKKDYDNWADLGNTGWDFNNVSHYFRKLENNVVPGITPNYHGKNGPITVSSVKFKSNPARAFVKAGIEKGYQYNDYNGPNQAGFSFLQATIDNGTRMSTNVAYLYTIPDRKNLHVKKLSLVTKLLIDSEKNVYGVEFISRGKNYSVRATKEVILSAGTINTPQIMMLSGIGPTKHLKELGIDTVVNLAVGYNLMDHTSAGSLTFIVNTTSVKTSLLFNLTVIDRFTFESDGPISSAGAVEALGFIDTERPNDPNGYPDIELMYVAGSVHTDPVLKRNLGLRDDIYKAMLGSLDTNGDFFMVFPMLMRPKSRGRIKLQSKNPFDYPRILPNYFSDPHDMKIFIRGIRYMIGLIDTKALRKINAKLLKTKVPGCSKFAFDSDDYWECFTRHLTYTIYHHCGTAKMGPASDRTAVVDPDLRVYGVRRLRVADASVMPEIITGHTNAPTIMIGEKAADLIKEAWK